MREAICGLGLLVMLGCGGAFDSVADLIDVPAEADPHPADFPLSAPEGGTLERDPIETPFGGGTSVTLQYQMPDGTDLDAVLSGYETELSGKGLEPVREGQQVSALLADGGMLTVTVTGERTLSLTAVEMPSGE